MLTCILSIANLKKVKDRSKSSVAPISLALFSLLALSIWSFYKLAIAPAKPPSAPELSADVKKILQVNGWRGAESVGARSSNNASSSKGLVLVGSFDVAGGESFRMLLVPVRMRGFSLLGTEDIRAYGTKERPLYGKMLTIVPDQFEVATDSSRINYLSTCVTRNGVASNKHLTLRDDIKAEKISAGRRIKFLLGLQPPRDWTCLFIQLSSRASSKQMVEVWKSIKPVVTRKWAQE